MILLLRPFQWLFICQFWWKFDVLDVLAFLEKVDDVDDEFLEIFFVWSVSAPFQFQIRVSRKIQPISAWHRIKMKRGRLVHERWNYNFAIKSILINYNT